MSKNISQFFAEFRRFIEKKFTQLTLYIIYFLGIGLSAIIAKIFGKKFLDKSSDNSNWQKINKKQLTKQNLEKMY
jgi:hypothetical protein